MDLIANFSVNHAFAEPKVRPELPFKCHKCQRSYKYKGSLTSHLKFDCGLDPTFSCTECDCRAKKKNCLRQHLEQVHNVDRSQLDNCGAAGMYYIDYLTDSEFFDIFSGLISIFY